MSPRERQEFLDISHLPMPEVMDRMAETVGTWTDDWIELSEDQRNKIPVCYFREKFDRMQEFIAIVRTFPGNNRLGSCSESVISGKSSTVCKNSSLSYAPRNWPPRTTSCRPRQQCPRYPRQHRRFYCRLRLSSFLRSRSSYLQR